MSCIYELFTGNSLDVLKTFPDNFFQICITSPPYWKQRDYQCDNQLGQEKILDEYLMNLVIIFNEVKRVLKNDGIFWLNIDDCYVSPIRKHKNLKNKNLLGIPWKLAFALQEDGWILRQDVIWKKNNPMPEGAKDRLTRAHEYIFLFSKSEKYFYNYENMQEKASIETKRKRVFGAKNPIGTNRTDTKREFEDTGFRNMRSVWECNVNTKSGEKNNSHYATYPFKLILPCVKAGIDPNKDIFVLDPFNGTGTTGDAAFACGANYVGIDINPKYIDYTKKKFKSDMFVQESNIFSKVEKC